MTVVVPPHIHIIRDPIDRIMVISHIIVMIIIRQQTLRKRMTTEAEVQLVVYQVILEITIILPTEQVNSQANSHV